MKEKYQLTLTQTQAKITQRALNFYFRSFLGQLDLWHTGIDCEKSRFVESALRLAMGLESNQSYGIQCKEVPDEARNAADIHDVIRHQFWKDGENRSEYTVDAYPASGYGTEPLPEIK